MVSSLDIKLSEGHIRAVIRSIDLDGGGYIDFKEFEAAVKRHEDVRSCCFMSSYRYPCFYVIAFSSREIVYERYDTIR